VQGGKEAHVLTKNHTIKKVRGNGQKLTRENEPNRVRRHIGRVGRRCITKIDKNEKHRRKRTRSNSGCQNIEGEEGQDNRGARSHGIIKGVDGDLEPLPLGGVSSSLKEWGKGIKGGKQVKRRSTNSVCVGIKPREQLKGKGITHSFERQSGVGLCWTVGPSSKQTKRAKHA